MLAPDASLVAIWLKRFKGGPMDAVPEALFEPGKGLAGNANQGGRRQVTILDAAVWEAVMAELGARLSPAARRANLLVRDVALPRTTGRVLQVGAAQLRILGPTQPCNLMEETLPGLEAALRPDWRGGAFGEVIVGGVVRIGDPVRWLPPS
ncbi:MAG TPA: MOSC domain-containing protein [Anaeromyxobacter sp.]|nr:MOSC domain-containing protein [Anaeromyxobacter sp.]